MADYARLFHGGKSSFGNRQLVRVQVAALAKTKSGNSRSRSEIHFRVERRAECREVDFGWDEDNEMAGEFGEELLKTF